SFGHETRPGRQSALVPFSVWPEIRDYTAFSWTRNAPGICPDYRLGLVRCGRGQKGRSVHRRRTELEGSEASCSGTSEGAYPVYFRLGVGRTGGGDPVSLHGPSG